MKNENYFYSFSQKNTQISAWEKFILFFIKPQYSKDEISGMILVFKYWNGKAYIIKELAPANNS